MNNKVLSIVVPTYNMEDYLPRCLNSLIVDEVNMDCFEVLVINDGSKDSSSEIAHKYQEQYPKTFRVIDKENGNYGSCINRALKEAVGKYVKVLDADDWFDTDTLKKFLSFIAVRDEDMILNNCNLVSNDNTELSTYVCKYLKHGETIKFKDLLSYLYFPQMHCVTYKLQILKDMHYVQTEGISYTDQQWVTKPLSMVYSVNYFDGYLYKYCIGRPGQTVSDAIVNKSWGNHREISISLIEFAEEYKGDAIHKKYLYLKAYDYLVILYRKHILESVFAESDLRDYDKWISIHHKTFFRMTSSLTLRNSYILLWRFHKIGVFRLLLSLLRKVKYV